MKLLLDDVQVGVDRNLNAEIVRVPLYCEPQLPKHLQPMRYASDFVVGHSKTQ